MIEATRASIERRGYFGTGLNQILADSDTPRGSLYFHFPGGKDELVAAAVIRSTDSIEAAIRDADITDPAAAITGLIALLSDRLEESGWARGCPIATVALEVAGDNDTVQRACAEVYERWTRAISVILRAAGRSDADDLAVALLALIEGGLILAQAQRSRAPLDSVARVARTML